MDPGAETGKGLAQLATDGPGADHGQARRQLRERKDGFVGEESRLGQARDGRPVGPGARRDYGPAEAKGLAGHLHRVRPGESTLPEVDIDAEASEPSRRVVGTDPGPQPAHTFHDASKIDPRAGRNVYPKLCSVPNLGGGPGGSDQCLGRYAADIEAVAPQEFALDQGHPGAQPGGTGGRDQSGGARTNHYQVVPGRRFRADPVRRVDVGHQSAVMFVLGKHFHGHELSSLPENSRASPVWSGARQPARADVLYLTAFNGAAAKLTLKRLHQIETTLYLLRSTSLGRS